jgi:hypothetical protein
LHHKVIAAANFVNPRVSFLVHYQDWLGDGMDFQAGEAERIQR